MVEIVSDLVGKTVEVRERYGNYPYLLRGFGVVRAVGIDQRGALVVLEHTTAEHCPWGSAILGGLETFHVNDNAIREVVKCTHCAGWKHPSECGTRVYPSGLLTHVCSSDACQRANIDRIEAEARDFR